MVSRDLQDWIEELRARHGFRLDAIFPADHPRSAELSGFGLRLHLEVDPESGGSEAASTETLTEASAWQLGRAGMQYRDLIPSRLGGAVIASHIRIPEGGPVPDYVHYHEVAFQMIYCRTGWVKVVYEDQGEPFVMSAGDCVLQPPTIRHRVLECSPGLEVVEIGCPAEHRTLVDHDLELPNGPAESARTYGGQGFVWHQAQEAAWEPWAVDGLEARDLGLTDATGGLVCAKVVRATERFQPEKPIAMPPADQVRILFLLEGEMELDASCGNRRLEADTCTVWEGQEQPLIVGLAAGASFLSVDFRTI